MTKTLIGTPDPDEPARQSSITWTGNGVTVADTSRTSTFSGSFTWSIGSWTITPPGGPIGAAG